MMTLGQLIRRLEAEPSTKLMRPGFSGPHSWRGDYSQIAFRRVDEITVGVLLAQAKSAVGATFSGYKGGEYTMTEDTPIHIDEYGDWTDGEALWELALDAILHTVSP